MTRVTNPEAVAEQHHKAIQGRTGMWRQRGWAGWELLGRAHLEKSQREGPEVSDNKEGMVPRQRGLRDQGQ